MDDLLREFLTETGERLDFIDAELVRFEREPDDGLLRNIFRLVHTIKGTCGFLGLPRLESLAHAAESLMDRFREGMPVTPEAVGIILATIDRLKEIMAVLDQTGVEPEGTDGDLVAELDRASSGPAATSQPARSGQERAPAGGSGATALAAQAPAPAEEAVPPGPVAGAAEPEPKGGEAAGDARRGGAAQVQTIRVGVETLEHLMTMVSELVLTRNQLLEISRRQDDPAYKVPLQRLSYVTAELQEGVMKTRMQPIGSAWQKLPRIVRDLAAELRKPIDLVLQGAETELDRQLLEVIKDPLTHMIRNSADHGLETPLERRAAGKPERGTIRLSASHEGGTIIIEIEDDGRGLDFGSIRRKALQRGLVGEAELERMTDAQVSAFVFHPGFSTAAAVTAVSGRGVGLDVVKTNIELIGGTVEIRSEAGCGTTFSVKIPLTLAIVAALIVSVRGQRFAIPQLAVLELVRVQAGSEQGIERLNGAPVLRVRDRLLPIVRIADLLGLAGDERGADHGFVVVTQVGRQRFGLLVDGLFHTEEIVVKPMGSKLRQVPFFSGHTILGDGAVVLILDPNGIARTLRLGTDKAKPGDRRGAAEVEAAPEQPRIPLLVFRAGGRQLKAVPLSLVTRLEEIDAETIEWAADRALIQYRGRLMPLVSAGPGLALRERGPQPLVVFSDGARSIGVAVDDIVDIVEDVLDIQLMAERPDLIGSAVIRGRATEIVDVSQYLPAASAGASAHAGSGTGRTVLLVENSPFVREMLAAVMRASGYHVIAPERPEEAFKTADGAARIDAVVADLDGVGQGARQAAGEGGFALVEALRQHPRLGQTPVVGIASTVSRDAVDRARRLGVTDFVQTFDRAGLLSALAEVVSPALEEAA